MKLALLGDMHIGARNSNQIVQKWQRKFFENIFWPEIDKRGIKRIIQVGDYFDNRKWINLQTMAFQREIFVHQAQERNVLVDGIVGNHDIPLRHSLANSSPVQILNHENNIQYYDYIKQLEFDGRNFTMMPWVCKENYDECIEVIKQGGDILVGHFEIMNFVMHPGAVCHDGLTPDLFKNWNEVITGHFHTQSRNNNIHYIGTPYQMTWNDANGKHGFWILDTEDMSREFIENPYTYFNRFIWEDGYNKDIKNLEDSYVKINVKKKTDFEAFEKFVDKINFNNPFELKIIEQFEEFNSENVKDLIQIATTTDLISEYIEDVTTDNNKDEIKNIMLNIHQEALQVDD